MDWTHIILATLVVAQAIASSISIAILSRDMQYLGSLVERVLQKM